MALEWVIEKDERLVSWRHASAGQAVGLTAEEAAIAASIDQAEAMRRVADGLFAIAEAIRETAASNSD